ncbi:hypothetical protein IKQ02_04245 [bacterium]|nr:hypothetical protein [bacterium]
MDKKERNKIIATSIMFIFMILIAFISFLVSVGLIDAANTETEDAGDALGVVFAIIILIVPLLAAAAFQLIPGIINITLFSRMIKTTEKPSTKTYSVVGLISSIVLTLFPIILAIVTILILQAE